MELNTSVDITLHDTQPCQQQVCNVSQNIKQVSCLLLAITPLKNNDIGPFSI